MLIIMCRQRALAVLLMIALCVSVSCVEAGNGTVVPTVIQVSDKVIVKDCTPFGTQSCQNEARLLKKPVVLNFEGLLHREVVQGEIYAEGIRSYSGYRLDSARAKWYVGADITMLSGVTKGQRRKIKEIRTSRGLGWAWSGGDKVRDLDFFVFDKPVKGIDESLRKGERRIAGTPKTNPYHGMGALIEKNDLMLGSLGSRKAKELQEGTFGFVHDDLRPGTTGKSALLLKPKAGKSALSLRVHTLSLTDCNRVYKLTFWGKAESAGGKLLVTLFTGPDELSTDEIPLTDQWKRYERSYDLRGKILLQPKHSFDLMVSFGVSGGEIVLDDMEMWGEGYTNPSPYVDEIVEALKLFKPGILRMGTMHGPGLADYLQTPIDQAAYTKYHEPNVPIGSNVRPCMRDQFLLCEYLQCEARVSTPGTIYVHEMDLLMEYLGAPSDKGMGRLRAKQGHPKPWTETLSRIHIQFGNEAWLFGGGYNGPDFWKDLIDRAKKSPYYDPKKIIFHAGGKATSAAWNIPAMNNCPNADCLTIAPYMGHRFPGSIREVCPTPGDRARWALAYAIDQNITGKYMKEQSDYALSMGMELSNYEINHHIINIGNKRGPMFGSTDKPEDIKIINEYLASQIAGVAVANNMLAMLREHHIRHQNLFQMLNNFFSIKLWGGVLRASMKSEQCRYRPTWLALAAVNRGIFGDLLTTTQTGAKPVFEAAGIDDRGKKIERPLYDCLWSYAFKDGKRRSLIVANLDTDKSLPIVIRVPGKPSAKAEMWRSEGKDFLASNELEKAQPEAFLNKSAISDFKDGYKLKLPPATVTTLVWVEQ